MLLCRKGLGARLGGSQLEAGTDGCCFIKSFREADWRTEETGHLYHRFPRCSGDPLHKSEANYE